MFSEALAVLVEVIVIVIPLVNLYSLKLWNYVWNSGAKSEKWTY